VSPGGGPASGADGAACAGQELSLSTDCQHN
jgi:hypothetical protein